MAWQIQEAKQKFSALVDQAIAEGPQTVSRRGKDVVIVISVEDYERMTRDREDFKEFLPSATDMSMLDLERDESLPCDVEP